MTLGPEKILIKSSKNSEKLERIIGMPRVKQKLRKTLDEVQVVMPVPSFEK